MTPVIVIPKHKVSHVIMSPCERYLLTYTPEDKNFYSVWNFQMAELLREFEPEDDEDHLTYRFSYDGNYIAKRFSKTQEKDGKTVAKQGLMVFEVADMKLIKNAEGQRKAINIDAITEWMWSPHNNMIVYL